jgi:hypothetical protein
MGAGYDDMKVRGSRYNTGEAIEMATDAGARVTGQWSGDHMALVDADAPDFEGGANRVDGYQYSVILNVNSERFLDEGEDARAHTCAKFGRRIFEEDEYRAYIVVDSTVQEEYVRATGPSNPVSASDFETLFEEIDIDAETALETIRAYNSACSPDVIYTRLTATAPICRHRSPTGRFRSTTRRTMPTRSPAVSPSRSVASTSRQMHGCWTAVNGSFRGCTRKGTVPVGSSSTIILARPGSRTLPSSGNSQPNTRANISLPDH